MTAFPLYIRNILYGEHVNTGQVETNGNSYGNILRRVSAFGGVQLFNIATGLLRGKFVAMSLGSAGMGCNALYFSACTALQNVTGLGLNLAIVREVSASRNDEGRFSEVLAVVSRLILLTAMLGAVACFLLAPLLSRWSFGNGDYTYGFMILAVFVALSTGAAAYLSMLQGVGAVRLLTRVSVVAGLTGLLVGVPLYYFFGTRGIVPALIAVALANFIAYYHAFRKATQVRASRFSWKQHKGLVKGLLGLGIILAISSTLGSLVVYAVNAFVRHYGSMEDVGLFQAANSLTSQYVGVVVSALAMDYFPRLSEVQHDNVRMAQVVNRQAEVVSLITAPLCMALIATARWVRRILLTDEYLPAVPLMRWLGLGILLQLIQFPLGYVYAAKGNKKVFFWLEAIWGNMVWLICSIGFFYWLGLIGLGVSLVARNAIAFGVDLFMNSRMYGFRYSGHAWRESGVAVILTTAVFMASYRDDAIGYVLMGTLLSASCLYSFLRMRRLVGSDK